MSTTRLETPAPTDTVAEEEVVRTALRDQCRMASAGLNAVPGTTMPEDAVAALRELATPDNASG